MSKKLRVVIYDRDTQKETRLSSLNGMDAKVFKSTDDLFIYIAKYGADIILVDLYSSNEGHSDDDYANNVAQKLEKLNQLRHEIRKSDIPLCWDDSGFDDAKWIQNQLKASQLKVPVAIYSKYGSIISKSNDVFDINSRGIYWAYKNKSFEEDISTDGINCENKSIRHIVSDYNEKVTQKEVKLEKQESEIKNLKLKNRQLHVLSLIAIFISLVLGLLSGFSAHELIESNLLKVTSNIVIGVAGSLIAAGLLWYIKKEMNKESHGLY